MKKIFLPLIIILLTLTSCELYYEESPYKINMITIGLDYSNTFQLVEISPGNYIHYDFSLDSTINDATDVESAFDYLSNNNDDVTGYNGFSYIQEGDSYSSETINDEYYPSKENIITALTNLSDISDENTINIIYYSGHGMEDTDDSFTNYDYDGTWVLATTDTDTGVSDFSTEDQLLSLEQIYELLEDVEGYTVILSDSCYSGNLLQDSNFTVYEDDYSLSSVLEKFFSSGSDDSSVFFISATEDDNYSYEPGSSSSDDDSHGYFTAALLEGLGWDDEDNTIVEDIPPAADDNILSLDSLIEYIKDNQEISLDSEYSSSQYPQISGWRYDLVLFSY